MNHLVVPDLQVGPGSVLVHLSWIAKYANEKNPDRIIQLGDWYDLQSLSSYDKGTRKAEGRRLVNDLAAGELALKLWDTFYTGDGTLDVLEGNHENRLYRHLDANPNMHGLLDGESAFKFEQYGWTRHPFLRPVDLDGVMYAHYFCRNSSGRVMQSKHGAPSAQAQVRREMRNCVSGHQQGLDWAMHPTQDKLLFGMIAGSCYLDEHEYIGPQGEEHWQGIVMLNGVEKKAPCPFFITLEYLCLRYTGVPLARFMREATDLELMRASV